MGIDWLTLVRSINWPQVVVSLVLGGIITYFITYFIQRWYQKQPQKSEFTITISTTSKRETDITSKSMQFRVGAKGDLQNVNILEVLRQVLAKGEEEEET